MTTRQESIVSFRTLKRASAITRPANSTAYAIGDVIANVTTNAYFLIGQNIANQDSGRVTRRTELTGEISKVVLKSNANQGTKPGIRLFFFAEAVTEVADNEPFAPTDADLESLVCTVDLLSADWLAANPGSGALGNSFCQSLDIAARFKSAGGTLHVVPVLTNTYTPVSGETFTLDVVVTAD